MVLIITNYHCILNIGSADYHCINKISKHDVINLLKNVDLTENAEHYKTWNFILYIKMGKETITFDDIETEKPNFYHYKTPIF